MLAEGESAILASVDGRYGSSLFHEAIAIPCIFALTYLPLSAAVRYKPVPMLGHVLGQRMRRWRGKLTG